MGSGLTRSRTCPTNLKSIEPKTQITVISSNYHRANNINMTEYFTPISGLTGGSLIGLSAAALLLFNGDILGASGVMSSAFASPLKTFQDPCQFWKLTLLSAFLLTSTYLLGPQFLVDERSENDTSVPIPSQLAYILAGLLVGFGTKLGNGCTSGHGVCGLARLSKRSFVAVMTFMTSAILTVFLTAPDSFLGNYTNVLRTDVAMPLDSASGAKFTTTIAALSLLSFRLKRNKCATEDKSKLFAGALVGFLFASGLAISQMVLGSKLFGFLNVASISSGQWDPTLTTVLGSAVGISMLAYQFVQGYNLCNHKKALATPLVAPKFCIPTNTTIDMELLVGTAIFGMGWGVGLLCPGPALFHAANGNPDVLFRWIPAFVVGSHIAQYFKKQQC